MSAGSVRQVGKYGARARCGISPDDMDPEIEAKLARLKQGGRPRLLDLFSGCGGLTLGFVSAGCTSVGGVEIDTHASKSHALNFHPLTAGSPDARHAMAKDILRHKPRELLNHLQRHSPDKGVDLIVGGPPCPAFTRVGRAKLREVYQHPEAFKQDPRATLYVPYLKYVRVLKPLALVMENVPDILNWGGHNLGDEICESLESMGYRCVYSLLNAANYGVPQMRERFFLIAVHKGTGSDPRFPVPTRKVDFPRGYSSSRRVALKNVLEDVSGKGSWYVPPPTVDGDALPAVSASDAIGDLPKLTDHLNNLDRRGARYLDGRVPHTTSPHSDYVRLMREWPGFGSDGYLRDHVTRCLSNRDYRLFALMEPGEDYPKVHERAKQLFQKEWEKRQRAGACLPEGSDAYEDLKAEYVPPYDPGKFPNKWRKMAADEPVRTLMAHLGKDTYSHIHYDSAQRRVISVREAARLQSFPDGFRFAGTMNPAFRQIGNSVPPLLAWHIAHELLRRLGITPRAIPDFAQEPRKAPVRTKVA
ncbi:DNA cytosine methyltransferase [Myxococcus sp. XM-1-1-1]|uniref:DNA cytosine methyltransferase n=1 Tax=Myxococcus sp. XM-1-1-1 TaxID=2874602 RepID=UPI001CC03BDC|nr:DNA cytosine methyltransferase [Myxococcus sp. XM-1-1-1]MBZ4408977.1 DNA cytosine methyltransferase [Myxococcus sp. XM-1-1-1]